MAENANFSIDLRADLQEVYSNLAVITHSATEFIVDFASSMPGLPKPMVKARIVLTPEHAKRVMMALQDNIAKYEASHGTIKLREGQAPTPFSMNLGGKGGEA